MFNIVKKIIKYFIYIFILLVILLLLYLAGFIKPTGSFTKISSDSEIGKRIVFTIPMVKMIDATDQYMGDDFLEKYNDFIMPRTDMYPNEEIYKTSSKELLGVSMQETFLVKGAFRFKRRGTSFAPDIDSKYYILEDQNKQQLVIELWHNPYGKEYKDVREIIN